MAETRSPSDLLWGTWGSPRGLDFASGAMDLVTLPFVVDEEGFTAYVVEVLLPWSS